MRGRSKSSNKEKTCRHYKKKWHIKCECYKLQNKNKRATANQKGKQLEKSDEASVAKYEYSEGELLVVFYGNSKPYEDWILDSGCTFHMCPNRN